MAVLDAPAGSAGYSAPPSAGYATVVVEDNDDEGALTGLTITRMGSRVTSKEQAPSVDPPQWSESSHPCKPPRDRTGEAIKRAAPPINKGTPPAAGSLG